MVSCAHVQPGCLGVQPSVRTCCPQLQCDACLTLGLMLEACVVLALRRMNMRKAAQQSPDRQRYGDNGSNGNDSGGRRNSRQQPSRSQSPPPSSQVLVLKLCMIVVLTKPPLRAARMQ